MDIVLRKVPDDFDSEQFVSAALQPEGLTTNPNRSISVENVIGRRDPLTELQQKMLTAAISQLQVSPTSDAIQSACGMSIRDFLEVCDLDANRLYASLVNELEKVSTKGVWLYEKNSRRLIRTQWFQSIEYTENRITFQFTDKILHLFAAMDPDDFECQLIKGIQYRGKHTLAVFDIIWSSKDSGITEYSIPELMKLLSLEHTRYSYGQLKLRVLEPSLQEIYDWDKAIFVRFGPTFSGRRVEGIWFQVMTGEEAKKMREKEPEFKFALPEQKPTVD
ncbi:replication initiation protein [Sporomusa acidovorans]|uniref:Initiator Rep protein WH1 domain-containing protein n=1 Tax=Sporomusa acidovorans (strain ATCC 49682 / DSM 3132 / Mol) TaxID=1123286 RepID=A0ABZ3IWW9_SPOA4|nr:replication initiation protein [Sporomusa acidovorans]OZC23357.1 initiator replication protein [Sporomusa acidovorans DSM 3132]SDE42934.1 Initiator Replication protein [Sporomusa acidovorans]